MSRAIQKLSAVTCKALKKPGRHSDGASLYLNISKSGRPSQGGQSQQQGKH